MRSCLSRLIEFNVIFGQITIRLLKFFFPFRGKGCATTDGLRVSDNTLFCFDSILINITVNICNETIPHILKKANRNFSPLKFYVFRYENKLSFVIAGVVVILQLNSQEKGWKKRKMGGRFLLLRAYWGRQSLRN